MRLPRILNQCHPIPGFVYGQASFAENEQAVLIPVRPRKRSAAICSGCHQPASGYDQSPTPRRFEFIGFWGYVVFLVYRMRRVNCKHCGVLVEEVPWGMGNAPRPRFTCISWGIGRANFPGRKAPKSFALPGIRSTTRWSIWSPGGWSIAFWERFAPLAWTRFSAAKGTNI
jgi:transposase